MSLAWAGTGVAPFALDAWMPPFTSCHTTTSSMSAGIEIVMTPLETEHVVPGAGAAVADVAPMMLRA